jgi:hypothetical protein
MPVWQATAACFHIIFSSTLDILQC